MRSRSAVCRVVRTTMFTASAKDFLHAAAKSSDKKTLTLAPADKGVLDRCSKVVVNGDVVTVRAKRTFEVSVTASLPAGALTEWAQYAVGGVTAVR